MKFGLAIMNDFPPGTVPAERLSAMREQVRAARDAGFDSVWVLQHYLGNMPTLQPLPTLAALAADAGEMHLGTNMFILPLHHPVEVAESFATLDHLSGGHAIAGVGMGYRENEFAAFDVALDDRVERFTESIEVLRELWSGKAVSYRGRHVSLDGARLSLVPLRDAGIPLWVGAGPHRTGAARAARLGDAWVVPPHVSPERLAQLHAVYRRALGDAGRSLEREYVVRREVLLDHDAQRAWRDGVEARVALSSRYADYNTPDRTDSYRHLGTERFREEAERVAAEAYLFTDPATCRRRMRELATLGVTYVIVRMQWDELPSERTLESLALFADEVMPAFAGAEGAR